MRSLTIKLILAFLVISLTVAALGAFFAWRVTTNEFQTFVVDRIQDEFIAMVSSYYQEHGSWLGILKKYPPRPPLQTQSQDPDNQKQAPISFALVDQTGIVLLPSGPYRPHDRVPANVLSEGTPIEIEGQIVGTALITGQVPELNSVEQRYLKRTNQALLLAALSATGIALILGVLLARSLTRPLRELTAATRAVARGDLDASRSAEEADAEVVLWRVGDADVDHSNAARAQTVLEGARHRNRVRPHVTRHDHHRTEGQILLVEEIADLLVLGRHLGAGAAVKDCDLAVAETACGAGAVHGHIAAADDADALTDTRGSA